MSLFITSHFSCYENLLTLTASPTLKIMLFRLQLCNCQLGIVGARTTRQKKKWTAATTTTRARSTLWSAEEEGDFGFAAALAT